MAKKIRTHVPNPNVTNMALKFTSDKSTTDVVLGFFLEACGKVGTVVRGQEDDYS